MPWYFSPARVALCAVYSGFTVVQVSWVSTAEDRFRRSLLWQPTIATIMKHGMSVRRLGASLVLYEFEVDGKKYTGDRFRSGGISKDEALSNPTLLGAGTELIVYYNPEDPSESAIKIQNDRGSELFFAIGIVLCATVAYRAVRCETVVPNLYYRLMGNTRAVGATTGIKNRRQHARAKMNYGKDTGAL